MAGRLELRRVLFIRTDRLGETLLNLPAVAALKAAAPKAAITVLADPTLHPLLELALGVDHLLPYQPTGRSWWLRALQLARPLRPHRFDLAIVSNPMKELHLAVRLAGIPVRVGYDRKWGCLLTHRLADRKALGDRHEVEYNLDLVRALGLPAIVPPPPWLRVESEARTLRTFCEPHGFSPAQPFIAVHPWSSNPAKEWPLERFRALIRMVSERGDVRIALVGGVEERRRAVAFLSPGIPLVNLVGQLSLRQLAALFRESRLLVSNDSGPVHLAAAVGTKTLALFGGATASTGPRRWGPWGDGHRVIWKPSMDAISVEEVFEALRHQLTSQ